MKTVARTPADSSPAVPAGSSNPRAAHLRMTLIGTATLCAVLYLGIFMSTLLWSGHLANSGGGDFAIYYNAARSFRQGEGLYRWTQQWEPGRAALPKSRRYVYPPPSILLIVPYSWLPLRSAIIAWGLTNLLLLIPLSYLLTVLATGRERAVAASAIVIQFTVSYPLLSTLQWGQVNLVVALLLAAGLVAYERNRNYACAACLVGGAMIKVVPLLPLLYLCRCRRSLIAPTLGALAIALSLMPAEWADYLRYMPHLQGSLHELLPKIMAHPPNHSLYALLTRLFTMNEITTGWVDSPALARALWQAAVVVVLALLAAIAWRKARSPDQVALGYCAMVLAPVVVYSISFTHYLIWLSVTFPVLWRGCRRLVEPRRRGGCLTLLAVSILSVSLTSDLVLNQLLLLDLRSLFLAPLVVSYTVFGILALFALNLALFRRAGRVAP